MTEDKPEYLLKKLRFKELLELAKKHGIDTKKTKRSSILKEIMGKLSDADIREYYAALEGGAEEITTHRLVPKHEIVDKKDVEALLKSFYCKINELPRIFDTDPMCLKIGARPGDIVRITRDSETAGEAYYYRLVVRNI